MGGGRGFPARGIRNPMGFRFARLTGRLVLLGLAEAAAATVCVLAGTAPAAAQLDDRFPFLEDRRRRYQQPYQTPQNQSQHWGAPFVSGPATSAAGRFLARARAAAPRRGHADDQDHGVRRLDGRLARLRSGGRLRRDAGDRDPAQAPHQLRADPHRGARRVLRLAVAGARHAQCRQAGFRRDDDRRWPTGAASAKRSGNSRRVRPPDRNKRRAQPASTPPATPAQPAQQQAAAPTAPAAAPAKPADAEAPPPDPAQDAAQDSEQPNIIAPEGAIAGTVVHEFRSEKWGELYSAASMK